jgi:hypothetical protein
MKLTHCPATLLVEIPCRLCYILHTGKTQVFSEEMPFSQVVHGN